jgi:hypothetical protein
MSFKVIETPIITVIGNCCLEQGILQCSLNIFWWADDNLW